MKDRSKTVVAVALAILFSFVLKGIIVESYTFVNSSIKYHL